MRFGHIEAAGILSNHLRPFQSFRLELSLNIRGLGGFRLSVCCSGTLVSDMADFLMP